MILIVLAVVEAGDASVGPEVLSGNTSLLRRVTNAIHKDSFEVMSLVLNSLMNFRRCPQREQLIGSRLVDAKFHTNLMLLHMGDHQPTRELVHDFLLDHCGHLASALGKTGRRSVDMGTGGGAWMSAFQLLRSFEAHKDLRYREVS